MRLLLAERHSRDVSAHARMSARLTTLPTRESIEIDTWDTHDLAAAEPAGGYAGATSAAPDVPVPPGAMANRLHTLAAALERCERAGTSVAVIDPAFVTADAALLRLLDDPSLVAAALVGGPADEHPVATYGANVLAVGTQLHPIEGADTEFLGALYLHRSVLPQARSAIIRALDAETPEWDALDAVDLLLTILVRSASDGVPAVRAVSVAPFPAARTTAAARAAEVSSAAAKADADTGLAERHAARTQDGVYSTFVLRRLSARLTPRAVRRGISANAVTVVSALIGVGGGVSFAFGSYPALVLGALLLQVSLVLDCVDGEIARATRTRSAFGAWLDGATDRIKEYWALAGLALAGAHAGHHLWTLATAAMIVQTARHMQDFAFSKAVLGAWRASFRDDRPLSDTAPWQRPAGAPPNGGEPTSAAMWLRRVLHMPIGERWLILSVAALCGSPAAAVIAYLAVSAFALLWSGLGAVRRTTAEVGRYGAALRRTLADYRDDGLLGLLVAGRSPASVLGWALPGLLTLLDGAAVLVPTAVWAPQWSGAAFGWFALVAWHRYDIVYRRGGSEPNVPAVIGWMGGGWLVRCSALIAGYAADAPPVLLLAGIAWLTVWYVPESLLSGARTRSAR